MVQSQAMSRLCAVAGIAAAAGVHVGLEARIRELHELHRELAALVANCDASTQGPWCLTIERLVS